MNEILRDEALEALSEDEFISCAEAVAQLWEDESKGKENEQCSQSTKQ